MALSVRWDPMGGPKIIDPCHSNVDWTCVKYVQAGRGHGQPPSRGLPGDPSQAGTACLPRHPVSWCHPGVCPVPLKRVRTQSHSLFAEAGSPIDRGAPGERNPEYSDVPGARSQPDPQALRLIASLEQAYVGVGVVGMDGACSSSDRPPSFSGAWALLMLELSVPSPERPGCLPSPSPLLKQGRASAMRDMHPAKLA